MIILSAYLIKKFKKTKSHLQKYQKPENCSMINVPQCNPETWNINLSSFQRSTNITLLKILYHLIKFNLPLLMPVIP